MVKGYAGYYGKKRFFENICAVESSAESRFHYGYVNAASFEKFKTYCGRYVKFRRRILHGICKRFYIFRYFGEQSVRNLYVADLHSFVESFYKWRGVKSHLVSAECENSFEHGGKRAFSVCSRNVYGRKTFFGISHKGKQFFYPFKARRAFCSFE